MRHCFIGIDAGTSGIRASVIDEQANEIHSASLNLPPVSVANGRCESEVMGWQIQLHKLIRKLTAQLAKTDKVCAIAIDGTSGTLVACDKNGKPLGKALMYNDQQSVNQAKTIAAVAPVDCAAHGASSSLAKALTLNQRHPDTAHLCHQADWLAASLSADYTISDENNCLKMGYDIVQRRWPDWLDQLPLNTTLLPTVLPPGEYIANIQPAIASTLGLTRDCLVFTGTTDSIAAFIATGANTIGDAVTSLGSTLVLKLVTEKPVFAATLGIYSHRLGEHWLVGGASNSGGRVLQQFFSQHQLDTMTPQLQPENPTGLNYYPLPANGERFPFNDSQKPPQLTPRPTSDSQFFQAILEGISNIEQLGYNKLAELSGTNVKQIFTCGGGTNNPAWTKIRALKLGRPIRSVSHTAASYGSALLALQGWKKTQPV